MEEGYVKIPIERYDELIKSEIELEEIEEYQRGLDISILLKLKMKQ